MYGDLVPNVFETPQPTPKPRRWLMPLVLSAIVIGATLALVAVNKAPGAGVQTTLVR